MRRRLAPCRDCVHFERCRMLFSGNRSFPTWTECDWTPTRFVLSPDAASPREKKRPAPAGPAQRRRRR